MKLNKFTVVLAILLVSILAIGAVSAESVDGSDIAAVSDGDIQESVAVTDAVDDLSTADAADETVGDDSSGPDDTVSYDLDDDTYSTYFNEDGTATDALSADGNYYLNVGTLTNKDIKIVSGQNIYIQGKDGAGIIKDGTITIGDGVADKISTVQISGLTFINNNKDAIAVNQYANNVAIAQNKFDLTYDDTYAASPMAIVTYGFVDGTTIVNNEINMESAAGYTYGIDLCYWLANWAGYGDANAKNFYVAGNDINIHSTAAYGMAEAMYLDTITNSVIEDNNIHVVTDNAGVANYGMQVADSWGFFNDPYASSAFDITIANNNIILDSADLAYGISVISLWPYDEDYGTIVKDIVISGNDMTIFTKTEGVGICAQSSDVSITDNKVALRAESNPIAAYVDSYIGDTSYGIYVNNFNKDMGYYTNNAVTDNVIFSNAQAINVAKEGTSVAPLVIESNKIYNGDLYLIDDDSYATYFNEDGTLKDDAPITEGDILLLGDLTNKKIVADTSLSIKGVSNKKLVNSVINLVEGADNSAIHDLDIEFTGDDTTGSIGLIWIKDVSNVVIQNNKIVVPNFVDKTGAKYGSSVYAIEVESGELGCKDISINNNEIFLEGTCRYLYGIDVFKTWGSENRNSNINIFENYVVLDGGSRMAEAIYVSESDDVIIDGNSIDSTSEGAAYGIATDQLTDAMITSNIIKADAATQAYGITATTSGTDTIIRANVVDAKGTGAVGIGINKQNGVSIENNMIYIDGGDFTTITSSDSLGTANAAILEGDGNTNVDLVGNKVSEYFEVIKLECDDLNVTAAPSGEGSYKVSLKTVDDKPLADKEITFTFNNEVFKATTDENGVAKLSFALNKKGKYPVNIAFTGDKQCKGAFATATITINPMKTTLTSAAKTFLATATTKKLTATLKDANGNAIAKKTVTFTVNGKTYKANTTAKGVATVKLALKAAKKYTVSIKFAGDNVYAASTKSVKVTLTKEKTSITAPKKTFKKAAKTKKVVITLKNSKGKAIAKKKITLTVNKKTYTVKTNAKGQAAFNVKLTKKGTFKYTVKFAGDTQYKAVTKKTGKIVIK